MALPARVEWAKFHEIQTRRTSMLKAMTLSLASAWPGPHVSDCNERTGASAACRRSNKFAR